MTDTRTRYAVAAKAGAAALQKYRPGHQAVALLQELAEKFAQEPKRESPKAPKSEWATMKAEITRKALTALHDATARQELGHISEGELWCVADALYDTTSGLVDPEISALIYAARQEMKEHAPV